MKLKYLGLILFIGVIILFANCTDEDTMLEATDNITADLDISADFNGIIPVDRAIGVIKNYQERRDLHAHLLPDEAKELGDSQSLFVSIEDVKKYIEYVEASAIAKDIDVNGLRFYFGAYASDDPSENRGYQTMVVFPTTDDAKSGIDYQAIDIGMSVSQSELYLIQDRVDGKIGSKKSDDTTDGGSSAFNDMNSSPPRHPKGGS